MLVSDSLPRKPEFDNMVPPDGIRIGETGTRAALVQNPRGVSLQIVTPSLLHFSIITPHSLNRPYGCGETRHSFTPHLQVSNIGKLRRAHDFWPVYPLLFIISKTL
jgi:hypothetical protein